MTSSYEENRSVQRRRGYTFTEADRLRKAREEMGLSQMELADRSDISRGTIQNLENGASPMKSLYRKSLSLALGVDAEWLATGALPEDDDDGARNTNLCLSRLPVQGASPVLAWHAAAAA